MSFKKLWSVLCGCLRFAGGVLARSIPSWTPAWSDEFTQANCSSPDSAKWAYDIGTGRTNTPAGLWHNRAVTNQFDPVTFAAAGSVTNLTAPSGTAFARYQIVFRQPLRAAGAVLFDDQKVSFSGSSELAVSPAASKAGNNLNLAFPTFFGLAYRVRFKNDLSDPTGCY